MHTAETLSHHPHLNPLYFPTLEARREAQAINRDLLGMRRVPVPKLVNRYLPHQGAKETTRYSGGARLLAAVKETQREIQDLRREFATNGFSIGDTVRWTSSNKEKVGKIVEMLQPGEIPSHPAKLREGAPRDHVSCIVTVGNTRYWPRVSLLEQV